ncbi:zinc metalloprotease [Nocardia sp. NPDC051570]|uniref:zinc metalloprotease n=1 Tax=Nocardia sp. NPDC051570 TaxID=3364324 RepID=UPI0037BBA163
MIARDNTPAGGNVPDTQISEHQMKVLNTAFTGTGLQFRLAGIDRSISADWFTNADPGTPQQRNMKATLRKGGAADLNLYTVKGGKTVEGIQTLGWSTFPSAFQQNPGDDGVVIAVDTLPGGSLAPHNQGINAVHEVGHWVGLYNTFQGGCEPPGDYVDDTPAEATPASSCPEGRNSCPDRPGKDPIHNYMDATDDTCRHEFTPGQIQRLQSQMATYRGIN